MENFWKISGISFKWKIHYPGYARQKSAHAGYQDQHKGYYKANFFSFTALGRQDLSQEWLFIEYWKNEKNGFTWSIL